MAKTYKHVAAQLVHYLGRVHDGPPPGPIVAESAWRGADLAHDGRWRLRLSEGQSGEIGAALATAKRTGKPLAKLTRTDFPLPALDAEIRTWRDILSRGRGFVVISGLPVNDWSTADAEIVFWCLGMYLGHPGAQNKEGDLLGHVRDVTGGAAVVPDATRLYKTSVHIKYHCDAADVVGLLCLNKALSGGESRIVSSVAVYNEMLKRAPKLSKVLFEPFDFDTVGEGIVEHFAVRPCAYHDGVLRTFYHSDYYRSVARHADVHISSEHQAALDLYDEIASSPDLALTMDLAPGDMQFVSNHTVLHSRTAYVDHDDPALKRHLLRLWLSIEEPAGLVERFRKSAASAGLIAGIVRERLRAS